MEKQYFLSKSNFIRGLQCHKSLWLYYRHPDLRDEISEAQQAIFDIGYSIGDLAQDLFPGGVNVKPENHREVEAWIKNTNDQIDSGQKIIYEAAFSHNGVFCAADIMVKVGKHWELYEVKGSTSVKQPFINDVALQYYVITGSGLKLTKVFVVHVNNQYVRNGEIDIKQLFTISPQLDTIKPMQAFVVDEVRKQQAILANDKMPNVAIGSQCDNPYHCDFFGHCWQHIPSYSPLDIPRLSESLKTYFLENNILTFKKIPADCKLTDPQWLQVKSEITRKPHIKKQAVRNFLETVNYPILFMDFETIMSGIPMFDFSRPYQQIPFQFSVHYLEKPRAKAKHFEFLAEADLTVDPRIAFIENLLEILKNPGSIFVYNQSFEITRLNEIARDFPAYKKKIASVVKRIVDLATPFRSKDYYLPEMKGSWSIKAVLPALVPEMGYDSLEIREGGSASQAFLALYNQEDPGIIEKTRKDLLEYCKMDTLAMVEIFNKLEHV